jgi:putative polymerase
MAAVWNLATAPAGELDETQSIKSTIAPLLVGAAVLFNFVLCFVNTKLFTTTDRLGIAVEVAILGLALGLIWNRSIRLYAVLSLTAAYFIAVMVYRLDFDPKIMRDILIPIVFFFLGRYLGSRRGADRLVTVLLIMALGSSLFELLAPGFYLNYFDVIHYYIARGTVTGNDTDVAPSLFFNGIRFEGRSLLPVLGDQRISGIFLEPPSAGNFCVMAFAWILLRDRQNVTAFVAKSLAVLTIIVLADSRFGLYFCAFIVLAYVATPLIRPAMLFALPFLAMIALAYYAGAHWQDTIDNSLWGRALTSGRVLSSLDIWQVFGLGATDVKAGAAFGTSGFGDSGYSYMLVTVGLPGVVIIWALFLFSPVYDADAARFKNFVAFYLSILLSISAAVFTIKTAALLWFLYGTLNNPNRRMPAQPAWRPPQSA